MVSDYSRLGSDSIYSLLRVASGLVPTRQLIESFQDETVQVIIEIVLNDYI